MFFEYVPEQFEILDYIGRYSTINHEKTKAAKKYLSMINGKPKYCRIIIKSKKINLEQFEILGITNGRKDFSKEAWPTKKYINAVRHNIDGTTHSGVNINGRTAIVLQNTDGVVFYTTENQQKPLKRLYDRILIKNLHPEQSRERIENNKLHTIPQVLKATVCAVAFKKVA